MNISGYCENCGSEAAFEVLFPQPDETVRCNLCGGWSWRGPLSSTPSELYDERYFNGGEYSGYEQSAEVGLLNFRRKLKILERLGINDYGHLRMVEIGSATGLFLEEVRRRGCRQLLGLEASKYGCDIAKSRSLETLAPDDSRAMIRIKEIQPNLLIGWDVWEHLEKPATIFDDLIKMAAPDVAIALTTVDAGSLIARVRGRRWRQFHPPTHLNFPTRASFNRFFSLRGFTILSNNLFGYWRPLNEYIRALPGGKYLANKPLPMWNIPLYLNLYDIQFVVARKNIGNQ
ncbi:MAG: class I SAM-dependent methyltransferase [Nitrospirae bacterium]|nr:class I SAM-dependent methyltransferase [Nitrospirota bacterium]